MRFLTVPTTVLLGFLAVPAQAYVGPGLGLGAIGAFFGILFAVFLAVVGIFWYPLKRLFTGRGKEETAEQEASGMAEEVADPAAATGTLKKEADSP